MKRPAPSPKSEHPTRIAHIGPTVVVRRRIVESPTAGKTHASDATPIFDEGEDESGPPSSVNVARALASLRADELTRLEQIMSDDEDAVVFPRSEPTPPSVPTVRITPTIALGELARLLSVAPQELVTACVTHGFFSVTVKSVLARETARAAAGLFGFRCEDEDEEIEEPPAAMRPKHAPKAKSATKPKKKTASVKKR